MTARTPSYLKSRFENGDVPLGTDYEDVFDSYVNLVGTSPQTVASDLTISGVLTASAVSIPVASFTSLSATTVSAADLYASTLSVNSVSAANAQVSNIAATTVSAARAELTNITGTTVSAQSFFANTASIITVSATTIYGDVISPTVSANTIYATNASLSAVSANTMRFSDTGGITGATNGRSVAAGFVGELLVASAASATIPVQTTTAQSIAFLPLQAGDYDVWGGIEFRTAATTSITVLLSDISLTPGAVGVNAAARNSRVFSAYVPGSTGQTFATGTLPVSVSASANVYLIGLATFTVSTVSAGGQLFARRRS